MQDWTGDTAKGAKTVFGEMRATIHPFNHKLLIERPPGKEGHGTEKGMVLIADARSFQALAAILDSRPLLASISYWSRSDARQNEFYRLEHVCSRW